MHVDILLYDGFDELDAVGPYEVFQTAGAFGADCEARLVTLEPTETVTASHGLRVAVEETFDVDATGIAADADAAADAATANDSDAADDTADTDNLASTADDPHVLLVPGGGWSDASKPGAGMEAERGAVPAAVAAHADRGGVVAGVCTGGMLLAHAGVLDGRPAVTHASALDDLRAMDVDVQDARFVDDGDVLTAGGVTSGLDLALHLVERECGADAAERVATEIEYSRRTSAVQN